VMAARHLGGGAGGAAAADDRSCYRFGPTRFSVIPKVAVGKLSLRFVPQQDHQALIACLQQHVQRRFEQQWSANQVHLQVCVCWVRARAPGGGCVWLLLVCCLGVQRQCLRCWCAAPVRPTPARPTHPRPPHTTRPHRCTPWATGGRQTRRARCSRWPRAPCAASGAWTRCMCARAARCPWPA
jgi:hypothetical protein